MEKSKYLQFFSEAIPNPDLLGGKGSNLVKLVELDANVPPGFILTTNFYNFCLKKSKNSINLNKLFESDLNPKEVFNISSKIKDLILKIHFPSKQIDEIKQAFEKLREEIDIDPSFAVRSSANIEDSSSFSFAGQAETYLYNNSFEDVLQSIKNCWASLFSPNALLYFLQMKKKGLKFSLIDIQMATIIQKMINSQISGVLFTANVINNNESQMLINSTWGLGDTITGGTINPDTFILNKSKFEIVKTIIGKKEKTSIKNPQKTHTLLIDTAPKTREISSLNKNQLSQLHKLGIKLENSFNFPQDIEWAIENDIIYVLQARPITTLRK